MTPGESLDQRLGAIERMLTNLRSDASDIRRRISALEARGEYKAESVDMAQLFEAVEGMRPYTVIRSDEYSRLLRVERAAREFLEAIFEKPIGEWTGEITSALPSALDGEGDAS